MIAAPPSGGMTIRDRRAMNYIDRDNPVFSEPIQSPAAWAGSEIGGKAGVSRRLTVAQIGTGHVGHAYLRRSLCVESQ